MPCDALRSTNLGAGRKWHKGASLMQLATHLIHKILETNRVQQKLSQTTNDKPNLYSASWIALSYPLATGTEKAWHGPSSGAVERLWFCVGHSETTPSAHVYRNVLRDYRHKSKAAARVEGLMIMRVN